MSAFEKFFSDFVSAIKGRDSKFLSGVYSSWLESSGVVPPGERKALLESLPSQLAMIASARLKAIEEYDGFHVALLDADGSEISMAFTGKGGLFEYFDAQSNLASFKMIYAIGYIVEGGRLRVLINGKRNPFVGDIGDSGFVSLINSALKSGKNEMALQALTDSPIEASIKISSAPRGEILDTNSANVLDWKGTIKGRVSLEFSAE